MNRNKIYIISFISLILALLIICTIVLLNNYKDVNEMSDANRIKSDCILTLVSNIKRSYELDNKPYSYTLEDIAGNKEDVRNLLSSKIKIILRYSDLNCDVCVDEATKRFIKFSEKIGQGKAAILVESKSESYLSDYIKLNNISVPIFRIIKKNEADSVGEEPFLFILDSNQCMKDVFYPHKELPSLSETYYDIIYKKYFDGN